MSKRKISDHTTPPTADQLTEARTHATKLRKQAEYERKKDHNYNRAFFTKWQVTMHDVFNHTNFDFTQVTTDFEAAAGDVSSKLYAVHAAISQASESSEVNIISNAKAFHAGSTWARFVPTQCAVMQEDFNYYVELCECKCKMLSQAQRKAFGSPGIVFFEYLPLTDVKRIVESSRWLSDICKCVSDTCLIQAAIMGDFVDNLHTDYPHYPHHDMQFSASVSCSFIVFLDNDITGMDGITIKGHKLPHVASTVLYMSGEIEHARTTSRAFGQHHAALNKGNSFTQRRMLLINCCPFSSIGLLDQYLNSDAYMKRSNSMKKIIFKFNPLVATEDSVSLLSDADVGKTMTLFQKVKPCYKKK